MKQFRQETHHKMRIPERDGTYIVLSAYLRTFIHNSNWTETSLTTYKINHTQVNFIQL